MFRSAPRSVEFNKLRKRLVRLTREAIDKFGMVRAGRALAGGARRAARTATACWRILLDLKWRGLLPVELLGLQPRPGPAELPQAHPAGLSDRQRHRAPHRVPGHLFDRHRQAAGGRDLLLALLAAAARPPLSHRAGGGLLGAGARAPSRGQPRDVLHEPVPRRQARGDAGQAAQRRWRRRSAAAADLLRRAGPRQVRRAHGVPHHPLRPLRHARKGSSATP